ncbi:cytochrome c oxidase subunit II [Isoptericola sp. b441]|uniref:cytochrome-c oxidase n=1 Tax=Actinotalea lenta TaxID=3064654 RepID=A0ABT9DBJ7_9CELL|nr:MULTISPECIES: cytochrome c oxidase subunit II [unclassified Isoptericola]MDO8107965.1 cytochrome c oxidase subunit II [Isoptericola sp. b441]MDO8120368.1 cytochrome c oxidase subunit II [Isoptericola sp. b490]
MVLAVAAAVLLSGCSADTRRGFLPGYDNGQVTNMTGRITHLWTGTWTAALAVGVITWGLIIWSVVVYRKRRDDDTLPIQTRYHVPLEIMYVVLPLFMIGVLYFYTERDMSAIKDTSKTPDVTIEVIGKRWSWDFNYLDSGVWESGTQIDDPGTVKLGDPRLPTLYLPLGKRVEFKLESRDVIHSFWVPAFLYKEDLIPGRTNTFQIVPERKGMYLGKCAELCGEYHSGMLFQVDVVSPEEYQAQMERLRSAGQVGKLGLDLNPADHPGANPTTPKQEG